MTYYELLFVRIKMAKFLIAVMEISSRDINVIIETSRRNGLNATEIHQFIVNAWGENLISLRRVQEITKAYREGTKDNFERVTGSGRPKSESRVQSVDDIRKAIEDDPCLTSRELSDIFQISKDTVLRILRDDLNFKCVSTKWVPHELSEMNKTNRVTCCENLIEKYELRAASKRIIITDEKWFYARPLGNLKTRRRWIGPHGDTPITPKRTMSDKKFLVLMAVSFDGLSHFKILDLNVTVNSIVYTDFLEESLIAFNTYELRQQHRAIQWENVILQHDNARPHISDHTMRFLESKNCQLLHQAPYSPDLNVLDRMVFPKLEMKRCKISFQSQEDLQLFLDEELRTLTPDVMKNALEMLIVHCKSVIEYEGSYVI